MEPETGLLTRLQPNITHPTFHPEETHPNSEHYKTHPSSRPEETAQHQRKISVSSQKVKLGEKLIQEEGKNDESCLLELPYKSVFTCQILSMANDVLITSFYK